MTNEYTFKLSPVSEAFIRHLMDTTNCNKHEVLNSILGLYLNSSPVLSAWYEQYFRDAEEIHRGFEPTITLEEFARRLNDYQGGQDND